MNVPLWKLNKDKEQQQKNEKSSLKVDFITATISLV